MATSISTQTTWHAKFLVWGLAPVVCLWGLFNLYLFFSGGDIFFFLIAGVILLLLGISLWGSMLTNTRLLTITRQGIIEKRLSKSINYTWNEIERIELTGKQRFKYLYFFTTPAEAVTIYLKNGERIILWYGFYKNMSGICVVLQRADNLISSNGSLDNLDFTTDTSTINIIYTPSVASVTYYSGLFAADFTMIFLFVMFPVFLIACIVSVYNIILDNGSARGMLTAIFGIVTLSLIFASTVKRVLNYFILDGDYLVIKNKLLPTQKFVYDISNVQLVIVEKLDRTPHSIRIITKQFENKLYPAGCLNTQKLREFITALEQRKVPLRNDIESFDYL